MRIRKQIRRHLAYILPIIVLTAFLIYGCKGKEEKQALEPPAVTEQQRETAETRSSPSSEKLDAVQQPRTINTSPRITKFNIEPKTPLVGNTIKADIGTFDKEADNVRIFYQWTKNDLPLPGDSNTLLLTREFKRGDKISVKAVPDDGKVKGAPLTVVVYITNASPEVKGGTEPFSLAEDLYTYQVKATDPDGDELVFALKEAPSGMTIDPKKGFIQWKVPPGFSGQSRHTVSVTDGHGGETTGTFTLDIQTKQKK